MRPRLAYTPNLPRRVFALVMRHGAHADCLIAGQEGSCRPCCDLVEDGLIHFYGHLDTHTEILVAIAADFAVDITQEQS